MSEVIVIDCQYLHPQFAASFLLVENGRCIIVENNTSHATPLILKAIAERGLTPDSVDYLIVTHAHLDHAGGTSALLQHCPKAIVLAHPKAAKTLISPEKLIRSAEAVYGKEKFLSLYGNISPIAADRVRAMSDGATLRFGNRLLKFFYTLGHASHHFCVFDSGSNAVFTGDTFGLCYPALQKKGMFIFPSTSPIDFDPVEAKNSLDKVLDTGASRLYLTHFGLVTDLKRAQRQMIEHLNFHEALLEDAKHLALSDEELTKYCHSKLIQHFEKTLATAGINKELAWPIIEFDIAINAQGIAFVAQRQRHTS